MDYEKSHKDTINRLQQMVSCGKITVEVARGICADFKPESEDEKIRKELIGFFKDESFLCHTKKDILAWLGKQGEQKPKDRYTFKSIPRLLEMIKPTDRAKAYCQKLINSLIKEGYVIDAMIVGECLKQMNGKDVPMAIMDEQKPYGQRKECLDCQFNYAGECKGSCQMKRDEQKSIDKVVPKFKIGDWIKHNKTNFIFYISKITKDKYEFENSNGYNHSLPIKSVDEKYHLWTIKDAKDGDVLACGDKITDCPFIFHNLTDELNPRSYCGINMLQHFQDNDENGGFWCCSDEVRPATKEQRDTLMKAMTDAGWEFDFDKKELKKISQRMVSAEAKEALYDEPTDEEMKELLRTEYEKGRADTIAEMKTAWSEEDEKMCQETINWFEKKCFPYALESENPARESIKWLKSLRPQNRWKPNEEQMEALRIAAEVGTANNSWAMGILKGMYNELKSM